MPELAEASAAGVTGRQFADPLAVEIPNDVLVNERRGESARLATSRFQ
jgi:hypothetical protein